MIDKEKYKNILHHTQEHFLDHCSKLHGYRRGLKLLNFDVCFRLHSQRRRVDFFYIKILKIYSHLKLI